MLLGAPIGPGDPYLNLWILGWGMQAVLSNRLSLFDGTVFNANIFFPAKGTLAYSDHLLLQSVVLSPLYAITHDVVLCYNVLLIASLVASALAMQALVRIVVDSEPGAYAAALRGDSAPYRFAHLIHLQLQSLYFLPLTFLFLHRVIAGRRRRDVVLLGVMAALQAISSIYYGVIGGLALIVGGLALAIGVGRWRNLAVLRRLSVAAVIAGVLVLPVAIVYSRSRSARGSDATCTRRRRMPLRSRVTSTCRRGTSPTRAGRVLHAQGPERELFPGFHPDGAGSVRCMDGMATRCQGHGARHGRDLRGRIRAVTRTRRCPHHLRGAPSICVRVCGDPRPRAVCRARALRLSACSRRSAFARCRGATRCRPLPPC
jgi:hypothetical protein